MLSAPEEARVLVEGTRGPLVVEHRDPGRHVIVLLFDVTAAPIWALEPNFVMFVQSAIEYLDQEGEALAETGIVPGNAITARLPRGAENIRLETPDNDEIALAPLDPNFISWGPVRLCGLYNMTFEINGDEQSRLFAVNMLNPPEGDLRTAPALNFAVAEDVIAVAPEEQVRRRPLWPWLLLAALVVLMIEWWVYSRRSYL
ncbi:MAG: hypothetical protein ACOC0P_07865 [Planctomycetota bacterium]